MYSARTRVENEQWVKEIETVTDELDLDADATSTATDLFLSGVPEAERSKRAVMAASIYAASLISGQAQSQSDVADAAGVARLTIQQRWKELLRDAGMEPPSW
ncbi:transcription initiation factor IIB family protein [Natranaeroarchaeum sulfidigenes]|uniref:Cyclin domain containing protein n=1 Tax=Natranaeroarchaeum sulfidigenes TaxID=2784880 RepID=A0A897MNR2_9EURY|nr:transcription initiation factor IIB family protein [Natranaeroarchaeum sulfidigenes]QSG02224.1 Cyclin domain containing protein [Natranaeroarchaeum sulfidigenes]